MSYEIEPQERPRTKARREYSPPTLTDYGCVSKQTQGGMLVGNDGNTKCDVGNGATVACVPS